MMRWERLLFPDPIPFEARGNRSVEEARASVGDFLVPDVCSLPFWKQPLRRCVTGRIEGDAMWITFHEPLFSRGHWGLTFFGHFIPDGPGCIIRGSFTYPWWSKAFYFATVGLVLLSIPCGGAPGLILIVAGRLVLGWMPSFLAPQIEALQKSLRRAVEKPPSPSGNAAP